MDITLITWKALWFICVVCFSPTQKIYCCTGNELSTKIYKASIQQLPCKVSTKIICNYVEAITDGSKCIFVPVGGICSAT